MACCRPCSFGLLYRATSRRGESIVAPERDVPARSSAAKAAFLSFLFPGLGQGYLRHVRAALIFAMPAVVLAAIVAVSLADGLTQTVTAAMVLRCTEGRRLSLDDTIGSYGVSTTEPDASVRQLLTHTSGAPNNLTFSLRLERLAPLWPIVRACAVDSFRETFATLLHRLGMFDSVPGPNMLRIAAPAEGVPHPSDVERYAAVLQRRATPYSVGGNLRASVSSYPESASVLSPATGLVTTVRDLAKFDLALKREILLESETLEHAWSVPSAHGTPLPHGIGWFVQTYNGEKVVWQFGLAENASSSLVIMLPARGLTVILMANSDGLVKLYSPASGDVTKSPFARLFLNVFVR